MHDQEFRYRKIMDEVDEKGTSSAKSIITLIKGKEEAINSPLRFTVTGILA